MTTTARLGLPLIEPGQAQKEMFHNEALALVDLALQAAVIAVGIDVPPAQPGVGDCWVIGPAPTGAWVGHADALASWTAGGWRFVAAREGLAVWNLQAAVAARFVGGRWEDGVVRAAAVRVAGTQVVGAREASIAAPVGGTVIDGEGRACIAAILVAMRSHGLIAT